MTPTPSPMDLTSIRFLEQTDSTSALLKREISRSAISSITQVVAHTQTAGVGRFGRPWSSPSGGLWTSIAIPLPSSPDSATTHPNRTDPELMRGLSIRVGVRVLEALHSFIPDHLIHSIKLKWPNDLVLLENSAAPTQSWRKLGGILIEAFKPTQPHPSIALNWLIVGVGINANFPISVLNPDLALKSATLLSDLSLHLDLHLLAPAVGNAIEQAVLHDRLDSNIIEHLRANLVGVGQQCLISLPDGSRVRGLLTGIDDTSGAATVQFDHGTQSILPPGAVIVEW